MTGQIAAISPFADLDSEHMMKSTRRPRQAFAGGKRQGSARPQIAAANGQGSKDERAHWQRRRQYYLDLAEAAGHADRVDRENYWQHAEHFHRLIAEAAAFPAATATPATG
jgi:uncharacterized protein DUF4167